MADILTLKYTPEQRDYAQVLRVFFLSRLGTRISLGFLVIAFGIIIYTIATQGTAITLFELVWLVFPPAFVVYVIYFQPNRMARQAMTNEQLTTETTWEVADNGVQMSTQFGSTLLEWSDISRLVTSKEYYLILLKKNKNTFRFIPRRVFANDADQARFVQLVSEIITK